LKNWKTTLGGILAAVGFAATQVAVPENYKWIFALLGAVGVALMGMTAKDFDNHSTIKEVEKATTKEQEK